jgi:hypothetical protein
MHVQCELSASTLQVHLLGTSSRQMLIYIFDMVYSTLHTAIDQFNTLNIMFIEPFMVHTETLYYWLGNVYLSRLN